jgi:CBS domain containing-hemolysin-like protein
LKEKSLLQKLLKNLSKKEIDDLGELNLEKKDMIRGIVQLSETSVKEVMVPRIDVVFLSTDMSKNELMDKITSSGHSRFPVYKETIDNVVGILYAKELLKILFTGNEIEIESIIRKPYFVPESKKLDSLLREMKRRRVHIAVGVDEYGGVSGIVCMEDILEEIVGDIQDEFDNEREDILEIGDGVFLCDARIDVEDLNEELSTGIPEDEFDTLGGYVFNLFGKIPVKYEKVSAEGLDYIIQEMDGHKIKSVKIIIPKKETAGSAEA